MAEVCATIDQLLEISASKPSKVYHDSRVDIVLRGHIDAHRIAVRPPVPPRGGGGLVRSVRFCSLLVLRAFFRDRPQALPGMARIFQVVGHSFGGATATAATAADPRIVACVG